ncbi:MAG: RagB/SusD family nutrient uptake outer membrane protein [Tannerellaceae bacterium]|jgi:hypothetical protein|nr:RagB/SusD family nutrient uptake outer membrane protein [Tannerellaceae bacterium]
MFHQLIKHISLLFVILAGTFLTACEKQVIDLVPIDKFSELTAFDTPEHCELSVIGAYDGAQCGRYGDSYSRGYPFGAASILQGEMRGEDMNLTAIFYDITYSATYGTSTSNNQYYWENSFECINRVNTVMRGIEQAVSEGILTEEEGDTYKGEMLFLRALTYHGLMVHFTLPVNVSGNNDYGLPLYVTAINTPDEIKAALLIGRSTVSESYGQILKDLDEAESLFSDNAVHPVNGITRVSKGSVIALKTRVYLHRREWEKVIEEAAKLVSGEEAPFVSPVGGYQLAATPDIPFTSYQNNTESIFSIENSSDDEASVNGAMAAMMSARTGGRAIVTSSPTLYNSSYWLEDDKRRELLLYRESDQYYFCDKYKEVLTRAEYAPIIRYAEVLLNYAEAALRTGDRELSIELLNAVRNRSLSDFTTQAYTSSSFTTDKEWLEAIVWERRIEFHGEGRRWEDIHRLAADDLVSSGGIPAKIEYKNASKSNAFAVNTPVKEEWYTSSRAFIPYDDKRFLWPIPVNDIVRNPTLAKQQNAGW